MLSKIMNYMEGKFKAIDDTNRQNGQWLGNIKDRLDANEIRLDQMEQNNDAQLDQTLKLMSDKFEKQFKEYEKKNDNHFQKVEAKISSLSRNMVKITGKVNYVGRKVKNVDAKVKNLKTEASTGREKIHNAFKVVHSDIKHVEETVSERISLVDDKIVKVESKFEQKIGIITEKIDVNNQINKNEVKSLESSINDITKKLESVSSNMVSNKNCEDLNLDSFYEWAERSTLLENSCSNDQSVLGIRELMEESGGLGMKRAPSKDDLNVYLHTEGKSAEDKDDNFCDVDWEEKEIEDSSEDRCFIGVSEELEALGITNIKEDSNEISEVHMNTVDNFNDKDARISANELFDLNTWKKNEKELTAGNLNSIRGVDDEILISMKEREEIVKKTMKKLGEARKNRHNRKIKATTFRVGDNVLVKSHERSKLLTAELKKFFDIYIGPFEIIENPIQMRTD
ncbi:uncharacterized protein LOC126460100 [Schistocerca serialis cubense]|uniref:uncharacterized protein LOC126460100 n=1 Tax=Schistocerca serialis cubense TaxID=2023355 RepID=UPI00214EAA16|nr:uncharacterized protein LOC126460100 [Schistocerca serialis cubense]